MMGDIGTALRWTTGLLGKLEIPYQVVGGLAAVAYGSRRPVADIDLYVPSEADLDRIAESAAGHVARWPKGHLDEHWDLTFMKLVRGRWDIEIAAASTARVWDCRRGGWAAADIDFDRSRTMDVGGVPVAVMPRDQLIDYKAGLDREVDRLDIQSLAQADP